MTQQDENAQQEPVSSSPWIVANGVRDALLRSAPAQHASAAQPVTGTTPIPETMAISEATTATTLETPRKPIKPWRPLSIEKDGGAKEESPIYKHPVVFLVIGIVIGLVAPHAMTGLRTDNSAAGGGEAATATTSQNTASTIVVDHTSDAIVISPIQEAATSVEISRLSIAAPVWVAVYEDRNGANGRVLGAARFTPERTSGTVELMRTTLPALTYHVGLVEDSVTHSFSARDNAPVLDASGNQIRTSFVAE